MLFNFTTPIIIMNLLLFLADEELVKDSYWNRENLLTELEHCKVACLNKFKYIKQFIEDEEKRQSTNLYNSIFCKLYFD
jgi:hypothetical protein